jgi:Fe/S biogenesis protein NfuA
MGIVDRLLGGKRPRPEGPTLVAPSVPAPPAFQEGVPLGLKQEKPVLNVTDEAKLKIRSILESQEPPSRTIRVSSTPGGKFSMNLEPDGKPQLEDSVLPYEGFEVFVDGSSLPQVEGATLNWVDTYGGGGFQFTAPEKPKPVRKAVPEGEQGEIWRGIESVLDAEINPMVASHGGHIGLIDYQDNVVYVEMSGGCQGCAMSKLTLKQGVERALREHYPEIEEVLDVTDHAGGRNPYYTGAG